MKLLKKQDINAHDIERVHHFGPDKPGTAALQGKEVRTGFDGKFSLEYNIAAAFVDKKVDLSTFSDERTLRSDLQAFMKKVHRYQDPEAALHSSRTKKRRDVAWLRVLMKNGTAHEFTLRPRDTLKGAAVVEKFRANAGLVLKRDAVERVAGLVQNLDKVVDTSELMDVIGGKNGPR